MKTERYNAVKVKLRMKQLLFLSCRLAYSSQKMLLLGSMLVMICLAGIYLGFYDWVEQSVFIYLLIFFFGGSFFGAVMLLIFNANRIRLYNKFATKKLEYIFNESGMKIKGEPYKAHFLWTSFHKVKELHNWFLLYTSPNHMLIVPKEGFESKPSVDLFRKYIVGIINNDEHILYMNSLKKPWWMKISGMGVMVFAMTGGLGLILYALYFYSSYSSPIVKEVFSLYSMIFAAFVLVILFWAGMKLHNPPKVNRLR